MNLLAISLSLEAIKQPPFPAITLGVVIVLALIYVAISKAVASKRNVKESAPKAEPAPTAASPAKDSTIYAVAGTSAGNLELVNTDEKTAAVIMAIVSNQSGIPLERLQFKSITLMED